MKKIVLLCFCVLMVATFFATAYAIEYPCEGVANASSVRVRKSSSTSGAQVVTLEKGEYVTIYEEIVKNNGDIWYRIETQKGKKGYVLSDYLSVPETERIEAAENSPDRVWMNLNITASCSNYNSVGQKWTQYYEWNGLHAKDGKMEGYVAPEIELSVYARVKEQDSKPDTSTEKTLYIPSAEDMMEGFSIVQEVRVTENSGRYAGNTAVWTITYHFTPAAE